MVAYNQVVNGMSKYIDQEIINKIQGWQKWVLGTGTAVMLSKGSNIFNGIKRAKRGGWPQGGIGRAGHHVPACLAACFSSKGEKHGGYG